jgi:superfamily II DNA/RNA helicase
LDEADRLVSCPDFIKIINRIRSVSTFPSKDKVQNLLFTATFPKKVEDLASDLLNERCAFVHNERTIATNSKIDLTFVECPSNEKKMKVVELLSQSLKEAQEKGKKYKNNVIVSLDPKAKQPRTLIFVERRYEAELMGLFLSEFGIRATTINGDRSQYERECALGMFRSDITPVLVATDVCARGLDIKDLDFVINMDLPNEIETFVHR